MLEEITIQKGIPIPERTGLGLKVRSALTLVMQKMEIGDCIDVPLSAVKQRGGLATRAKTLSIKVTMRTIDNGQTKMLRVWRIK